MEHHAVSASPLKLLVLEDSESDAELAVRELKRAGYELAWRRVEDEEGFAKALAEDPLDVILADFSLPSFDAMRALELLKESGRDIPFIIVSGSIGEDIAVHAMKEGATDYIIKDRLGRLGQSVAQALAKRQLQLAKRESDEALKEVRQRLELALWGTELGVWDWQLKTGEVTVDDRWAEMLGFSREELDPTPAMWTSRIHPEDKPRVIEALNAHVEGRSAIYELEHRLQTKSGEWKWIQTRGRVVERDAHDGRALRITGTHQDISKRKEDRGAGASA
jgi:PAS domain S-box-containing protein